jgi:hypothetical protein
MNRAFLDRSIYDLKGCRQLFFGFFLVFVVYRFSERSDLRPESRLVFSVDLSPSQAPSQLLDRRHMICHFFSSLEKTI